MRLSAVILAGGESRRMGRDKAWASLDGEPLLARQIALVARLGATEIFISGRAQSDYSHFVRPVLLDEKPGLGPLGGIERALHAATCPLVLVLAVDLAQMTEACLCKLVARCGSGTGAVPELDGKLEPLAAVYPNRCHALAAALLAGPCPAARAFAEACVRANAARIVRVSAADVPCFTNCNTQDDLALVRGEIARKAKPASTRSTSIAA